MRGRYCQPGAHHPLSSIQPLPDPRPRTEATAQLTMADIVPPFTHESALKKVKAAQNLWNTRNPEKVVLAYTVRALDSRFSLMLAPEPPSPPFTAPAPLLGARLRVPRIPVLTKVASFLSLCVVARQHLAQPRPVHARARGDRRVLDEEVGEGERVQAEEGPVRVHGQQDRCAGTSSVRGEAPHRCGMTGKVGWSVLTSCYVTVLLRVVRCSGRWREAVVPLLWTRGTCIVCHSEGCFLILGL